MFDDFSWACVSIQPKWLREACAGCCLRCQSNHLCPSIHCRVLLRLSLWLIILFRTLDESKSIIINIVVIIFLAIVYDTVPCSCSVTTTLYTPASRTERPNRNWLESMFQCAEVCSLWVCIIYICMFDYSKSNNKISSIFSLSTLQWWLKSK